jgi:hypothetical protein
MTYGRECSDMSPGNRFKSESFCTRGDTDFNIPSDTRPESVTRSALHSQGRATHERDWAGGFAAAIDGTANRGGLRYQIRIPARISPFSVPSYAADTPEAPERSDEGRSIQSSCYPLQATLKKPSPGFTIHLPRFFPVCLSGPHQIPSGPRKRVKQWDRVKQRLIIGRTLLI